jgi:hypothetical protein
LEDVKVNLKDNVAEAEISAHARRYREAFIGGDMEVKVGDKVLVGRNRSIGNRPRAGFSPVRPMPPSFSVCF